jgi:Bifunctional DNA primase/polymerase, N-terminal/Primase C terminal 1 (PriCT-1)
MEVPLLADPRTSDGVTAMDEAIRDYLGRSWSIIPIKPGDKRPLVRWEDFQHCCPGEGEARGWFRTWPDAGIGVVTGTISGLVVIDIDVRHGGDVSLEDLERVHGRLPTTVECRSGGGRHLYFGHPGSLVRNKVGLAPGIDLRGDGGYVVAPPSVHSSGVRYAWVEGCDPKSTGIARLPDWVLRRAIDEPLRRGHSVAYWRRLVADGVPEGERNNTIASLAGHLLRHGVDPTVVMELLLSWNRVRCRPPLADEEVTAVVESITRIRERGEDASRHLR